MTKSRSPITTHVLNVEKGKPGVGISVQFECLVAPKKWTKLAESKTNQDGRVEDLLAPNTKLKKGIYRLTFKTKTPFYPEVAIQFQVDRPAEHYHVPLLLSSYGYSTYRGT